MMKETFITGMRRIAYPVCIVSACANGKKLAITVSSVTSVSIEPPTLLVCINNSSSMAKAVRKGSLLNVNFLNSTQSTLSDICANKNKADMRFSSNEWLYDPSGTPYVDQCEMVAFCEVDNVVIQSTHSVAFLAVAKVNVSQITQSDPLIYHNGSYLNIKQNY
jgi:flavin reductase (DIM6/NTAB) family NADH-FMN oxidoreductase RutF